MKKNGNETSFDEGNPLEAGVEKIVSEVKEKGKILIEDGWDGAKEILEDQAETIRKKAEDLSDMTVEEIADDVKHHVRRHPLASVAIALGLGFLIGSIFHSD